MIPYFLKKNLVRGHKIFEFDCSYVVLLCNTPQRNSTMVSFFSLFTMHQNMQHEKFNIKKKKKNTTNKIFSRFNHSLMSSHYTFLCNTQANRLIKLNQNIRATQLPIN